VRGKDYNAGLRGVLFEARHYERMGAAIWLYGWLVLRQTRQEGSVGWVLGGAHISYREIEEETGFNRRTLERWMQTLRRRGYIETESSGDGVSVRITKAKKFQRFPQFPQAGRGIAEGGRESAEGHPQNCGASAIDPEQRQQFADGIGSSSVERYKEQKTAEIHGNFHNSRKQGQNLKTKDSCLGQDKNCLEQDKKQKAKHSAKLENTYYGERQDFGPNAHGPNTQGPGQNLSPRQFLLQARLQLELLRAEREEAVQRELRVGSGPEVNRR
jgi:hypothetical protein